MSLFSIFDISSMGMAAQSVRMNTIASNLANANNVANDKDKVYKAKLPIFATVMEETGGNQQSSLGVRVLGIVEKNEPALAVYDPSHPMANKDGYIFKTNVNSIEEMANMISASRTFQNNIEIMNTTKNMLLAALRMGQ